MTVRCAGDTRLIEQVGEKQAFECALTQRGLRHENFSLRVRRLTHPQARVDWSYDYAVTVMRDAAVRRVYAGGPAYRWVERFATHLARGFYDQPLPTGMPSPRGRRDDAAQV